ATGELSRRNRSLRDHAGTPIALPMLPSLTSGPSPFTFTAHRFDALYRPPRVPEYCPAGSVRRGRRACSGASGYRDRVLPPRARSLLHHVAAGGHRRAGFGTFFRLVAHRADVPGVRRSGERRSGKESGLPVLHSAAGGLAFLFSLARRMRGGSGENRDRPELPQFRARDVERVLYRVARYGDRRLSRRNDARVSALEPTCRFESPLYGRSGDQGADAPEGLLSRRPRPRTQDLLTARRGLVPPPPGSAGVPATGFLFRGAEVEPMVARHPADPNHLIGVWQQDRWSDGGAAGLLTAASFDGGRTWSRSAAPLSRCTGGNAANGGDYPRASDPWVTISPDGTAYQIAIAFGGGLFAPNSFGAVLVSRSADGGRTWGPPTTLISDP